MNVTLMQKMAYRSMVGCVSPYPCECLHGKIQTLSSFRLSGVNGALGQMVLSNPRNQRSGFTAFLPMLTGAVDLCYDSDRRHLSDCLATFRNEWHSIRYREQDSRLSIHVSGIRTMLYVGVHPTPSPGPLTYHLQRKSPFSLQEC